MRRSWFSFGGALMLAVSLSACGGGGALSGARPPAPAAVPAASASLSGTPATVKGVGAVAPVASGMQHLYVLDRDRVLEFPTAANADGLAPQKTVPLGLGGAHFSAGVDGWLYVVTPDRRSLYALAPGSVTPQWTAGPFYNIVVADGHDGVAVAYDYGFDVNASPMNPTLAVLSYDNGRPLRSTTYSIPDRTRNGPGAIATDGSGNFYVPFTLAVDQGTVEKFPSALTSSTPSQTYDNAANGGVFDGIAVGADGTVYIAERQGTDTNEFIRVLNPDGSYGRTAGYVESTARFAGVAVDAAGNVYVAKSQSYQNNPDEIDVYGPGTDLRGCSSLDPLVKITHASGLPSEPILGIAIGG